MKQKKERNEDSGSISAKFFAPGESRGVYARTILLVN